MALGILSRIRNGWRHSRIVTRLTVFVVLVVLIGFIGRLTILSNFIQADIQSFFVAQQLSAANYVAHDVEERIAQRLALLRRLAARLPPSLFSNRVALEAWLGTRQEDFPLFSRGLVLIRADGRGALADYPVTPGRRDLDFRDQDWFRAVLRDRAAVIGAPARSRLDGVEVIIMAAPVLDKDGWVAGVLAGVTVIGAPGFLDLLHGNRLGKTGGFLLISPQERVIVTATDPGDTLKPLPSPGVNNFYDEAVSGYRGVATEAVMGLYGVEELSAVVPVPTPGWFLVARLPAAEAFHSVASARRFLFIGSAATAVGAALLVSLFLSGVFRPLTDAARQMRGMAEGTVPLAPLPVVRMDEVGDLALGFNYLLEKLRENEAALRESEARMAHMAHHDALTGLPNRAMFEDRLFQAIARAERSGTEFGLLFIDLDGFKPVNDRHGHKAGDAVLRQVGGRLASIMRKADTVARIGGDEFAVLLDSGDDPSLAAEVVARKCREVMAEPVRVDGLSLVIGLSIGVARYPADGRQADQILASADTAMYIAKRAKWGR